MSTRRKFMQYAGISAAALGLGLRGQSAGAAEADGQILDSQDPQCSSVLDQIDQLMQSFLLDSGVTAGQIAIYLSGQLLMNRGYKNAGSDYPDVTEKTLFRLASCSKIFVCAAITALAQEGKLDLNAKVFPLLGITSVAIPTQTPSPYINNISVIQLVNHAGGWNDHDTVTAQDGTVIPGTNLDPMFNMRNISLLLQIPRPVTKRDIAEYMYGEPLQFVPGTQNFNTTNGASYSNIGYMLLGLVIEEVTGEPFVDYVRSRFSTPTRPLNVYFSRTLGGALHSREVWYTSSPEMGPSALEPHADVRVPLPYGGEGWMTESADSSAGLMTTAATLAKFISTHAVWGLGGRTLAFRDGSMAGTSSYAQSLTNGVDCSFILNTRAFDGGVKALNTFTKSFTTLVAKL
jgi:CubicO group peptidase (beta-lactamase class C family)